MKNSPAKVLIGLLSGVAFLGGASACFADPIVVKNDTASAATAQTYNVTKGSLWCQGHNSDNSPCSIDLHQTLNMEPKASDSQIGVDLNVAYTYHGEAEYCLFNVTELGIKPIQLTKGCSLNAETLTITIAS